MNSMPFNKFKTLSKVITLALYMFSRRTIYPILSLKVVVVYNFELIVTTQSVHQKMPYKIELVRFVKNKNCFNIT